MADRFRFNQQIFRLPVGDQQDLLHCDITGATKLVTAHEYRMLRSCTEFASLDQHAQRICTENALGQVHVPALIQRLTELSEDGLLLSYSGLLNRFNAADGQPGRIEYLGIPTFNRPESLRRCMESYAKCAEEFGRTIVFVVADQSTSDFAQSNIAALEAVKRQFPRQEICHVDQAGAKKFASQLARHVSLPPNLIESAITKSNKQAFAGGANRNLLLLYSAGAMSLQVDDDGLCRIMPIPQAEKGLTLTAKVNPTDQWFPSEEELSSLEESLEKKDLFALHESFLGKTVSQSIRESDGDIDLDETCSLLLRRINPIDERIVVSNVGVFGESGRRANAPFLLLEGLKRERLTKSEEHYRYVQTNQQILCGMKRATLSIGTITFGFNLAFDGRYLLPPFIPLMRGEDSVFVPLLRSGASGGMMASLPWIAHHRGSGEKRRPEQLDASDAVRMVFADLLGLFLQSRELRSFDQPPAQRLESLGNAISEIGNMPLPDFERTLRKLWWHSVASQLHIFEQSLQAYKNQPHFWSKDVKEFATELRKSMVDPQSCVSKDVVAAFGVEDAREKQKELVHQFGELLKVWPQLMSGAKEMRQSGGMIGRQIEESGSSSRV